MRLSFRPLRLVALAAVLVPTAALGGACASGGVPLPGDGEYGPNGIPNRICLLHNCNSDLECEACSEGRTTCLVDESRCVACDADAQTGCAEGEFCSRWGSCVSDGATCPVDDHGSPVVSCSSGKDCLACDPFHQVCDTTTARCVACSAEDTAACQATEACVDGFCLSKCPQDCTVDDDCASCGAGEHELHVCYNHKCSECSPDRPCPPGTACTPQGTCVSLCGTDGVGACATDADCGGCAGAGTRCHGGTCGPEAAACDDLAGVPLLPEPWGAKTTICGADGDCAAETAQLDVGAMLRDLTGIDTIGDATLPYPMDVCADVVAGTGGQPVQCGACVPCETDADCEPVNVDPASEALFGPEGSVQSAYLLDQVFGPSEHVVHMYCETVGAGYGACSPCPGYLNACAVGGGGGGGGTCDHDTCTSGGPLGQDCDACTQALCAADDYCCSTAWDALCVTEVEQYCGMTCGAPPVSCEHSECVAGGALVAGCSECATAVCAADDYCCSTTWDSVCVNEAATLCTIGCSGGTCAHAECEAGAALADGCSSCATNVCAQDSYCCTTAWDATCVSEVAMYCAVPCSGG